MTDNTELCNLVVVNEDDDVTEVVNDDATEDEVVEIIVSQPRPQPQQHQNKPKKPKRYKEADEKIKKITNGSIKRIARRAGIPRISAPMYDETRIKLEKFIKELMKNAVTYQEYCRRKTINSKDVVAALERMDKKIYI